MSYLEDEDDEDLFTKMMRLRKMIATVPEQADLISEETRKTMDQVSREISRVRAPRQQRVIRRVSQPELPTTAAPELPATTSPQIPAVPTPEIPRRVLRKDVYGRFAGRRKKMPDMFSVFTGRRRK